MNFSKKAARAALQEQLIERTCAARGCDLQSSVMVRGHLYCRAHGLALERAQSEEARRLPVNPPSQETA